jgi:hypothetical protein
MVGRCKVCFKPILRPEDGVRMAAFGRGLFLAHKNTCAPKAKKAVSEIVQLGGEMALEAAERRYPGVASFAKTLYTHLRTRAAVR